MSNHSLAAIEAEDSLPWARKRYRCKCGYTGIWVGSRGAASDMHRAHRHSSEAIERHAGPAVPEEEAAPAVPQEAQP